TSTPRLRVRRALLSSPLFGKTCSRAASFEFRYRYHAMDKMDAVNKITSMTTLSTDMRSSTYFPSCEQQGVRFRHPTLLGFCCSFSQTMLVQLLNGHIGTVLRLLLENGKYLSHPTDSLIHCDDADVSIVTQLCENTSRTAALENKVCMVNETSVRVKNKNTCHAPNPLE